MGEETWYTWKRILLGLMAVKRSTRLKITVLSSFVLLNAFPDFGKQELKQEQFAMDVEKTCFIVRRNLHWNRFSERMCHPHRWKLS